MIVKAFPLTILLLLAASGAEAADVSVKGTLSDTLDGGDNYFLVNSPSGPTGRTLSAINLATLARTPDTRFLLNTDYSYYKYFGPGTNDSSLTWGTPADASLSVDHFTKLTKYNFIASWNRADAATTQLAQSGVATLRGTIDTFNVGGSIAHDLSRIDTINLSTQASKATYSDPTQLPYVDLTTALTWNHNLSPIATWINSASFDWFEEDNTARSQRLFWRFTTGLQARLSSRLNVYGDVGLGFVNSYQTAGASAIIPTTPLGGTTPFQPQVGTGNSVLADLGLDYSLTATTTVSAHAAQSIVPLITGQLQKSETIGGSVNHTINYYSNIAFSTQYTYLPAVSGNNLFAQSSASEFLSGSVSYSYQWTREWHSTFSYTYLQRDDDTGLARSNIFLVSLARDFTLIGNPTGLLQAEAARARERERNSIGYVFPNFR